MLLSPYFVEYCSISDIFQDKAHHKLSQVKSHLSPALQEDGIFPSRNLCLYFACFLFCAVPTALFCCRSVLWVCLFQFDQTFSVLDLTSFTFVNALFTADLTFFLAQLRFSNPVRMC